MKSKKMISLVILIWIALQVYAGVKFHHRSWPFVAYPMYSDSHRTGDRLERIHLLGRTAAGGSLEAIPEDFGLWFWPFNNQVKPKLLNPQTRQSCAAELISLYNERHEQEADRLVGLSIEMEYIILTEKGPPEVKFEPLFAYDLDKQ